MPFKLSIVALLLFVMCFQNGRAFGRQDVEANPKQPALWCVYEPPSELDNGKRVVLLSGDEEYRSEEALPMLGKILAKRHGFHCTVLFPINPEKGEIDPNNQNNIPGMEFLDQADLIIMSWRFRCPPDQDMQHFAKYMDAGKPIIGLRTSTHAFRYAGKSTSPYKNYSFDSSEFPGGFGKQVLGETWVSHHGNHGSESTRGVINQPNASHEILRGVDDVWGPTDVYGINKLPDDAKVLMYGAILKGMKPTDEMAGDKRNAPKMPLVWIRELDSKSAGRKQRIFATTMGAATDFECEDLRRLIVNAAFWCIGQNEKITPGLDVDLVDEFKPTPFGFNKFQTGKKPSDYDLQKK